MTKLLNRPHTRTQPPPGSKSARRDKRKNTIGSRLFAAAPWYVMIVPALALVAWLIAYPFVNSILLSFQKVSLGKAGNSWMGLDNYTRLFQDSELFQAIGTTLVFSVFSVALQLVLAWTLALLLWGTTKRIGSAVRVLFAIPMLLSPVVVGVVWSVLLNPQYGWIPSALHLQTISLLGDPSTALTTLILVETWQWTPFMFLIIAAGLNSIPDDVLEAARIDGSGSFRLFGSIIWPLTLPVTFVALLFRGLDALKAFDLPYNLTGGGPGTATQTMAIYLYRQAFTRFDQGYASAIAMLTTAIMAAVAVVILLLMRRSERKVT